MTEFSGKAEREQQRDKTKTQYEIVKEEYGDDEYWIIVRGGDYLIGSISTREEAERLIDGLKSEKVATDVGELVAALQKYPPDAILSTNVEGHKGRPISIKPLDYRKAGDGQQSEWSVIHQPTRLADVNVVQLICEPAKIYFSRSEWETAEQRVFKGDRFGEYYTASHTINLQDVADPWQPERLADDCEDFYVAREGTIVPLPLKALSQAERNHLRSVLVNPPRPVGEFNLLPSDEQIQKAFADMHVLDTSEAKLSVPPHPTLVRRLTANSQWEWSENAEEWKPVTDETTLSLIRDWKWTYDKRYGLESDDENLVLLRKYEAQLKMKLE